MGRCILYTGIRLLLLICLYFSFSPNFQTLKFFVTLFSGTVRPRRLKLGTHTCGWWADVPCIPESGYCSYFSIYFFIFLSLQFSTLKFFITFFPGTVMPRSFKIGSHVDGRQMYHVYQNQAAAAYSSLYFFIFLSLQFSTLKFFITLFSGTVRPRRLKLSTHIDNGQMYLVYWNQAAALIHPYISSFSFLSNFQHWNFSSHFSQELWDLKDWNWVHT